jgi:hypothetical protein
VQAALAKLSTAPAADGAGWVSRTTGYRMLPVPGAPSRWGRRPTRWRARRRRCSTRSR